MKTVSSEPRNIVVFEPYCRGVTHVAFNAAFLMTSRTAFPSARLYFYADRCHLSYVESELRPMGLRDVAYHAVDVDGLLKKSFFFQVCKFRSLFEKACRLPQQTCFILSCATASSLCALSIARWGHKGMRGFAVFHSSLAGAFGWRSLNPFYRIQDLRSAMSLSRRAGVRFIVLEESIRHHVCLELPSWRPSFSVLDHPILEDHNLDSGSVPAWPPLKFAFLGLATDYKGFGIFLDTAQAAKIMALNAEFHVIGRKDKAVVLSKHISSVLARKPSDNSMKRSEYEEAIRNIHFCVFPYDERHYRFTASGALMDAFCWGKPIIAPDIPLFKNIFDRYGKLGYLYNRVANVMEIIQRLSESFSIEEYQIMQMNCRKVCNDRLPKNVAPKVLMILRS